MDEKLTSSKAAALLGVSSSTVKRWADEGRLPTVITVGGHRRFERLAVENFLSGQGQKEGPTPSEETSWLGFLLEIPDAHTVAGRLLAARGVLGNWASVGDELGEAMAKVGELWHSERVSISQEHRICEAVTRGISLCIASLPAAKSAPVAALAMAQGDDHVLGLRLSELCLRARGLRVEYLGRSTPREELLARLDQGPLALLGISAAPGVLPEEQLADLVESLAAPCARTGTLLVLGGGGAWPVDSPGAHRVRRLAELDELVSTRRLGGREGPQDG